ncbi:MAG: TspO/MBR family protein [Pseudomonadota bacterium]
MIELMTANWQSLLVFVGACFLAASSGGIFKPGEWYEALEKPPWCPPNWVFAPAWTVLFLLIALAGWRVFLALRADMSPDTPVAAIVFTAPLIAYGIQLVLNALWSALFFGAKRPDWAMIEVVIFLAMIIGTAVLFFSVDSLAAIFFLPYIAWVSFAAVLNFSLMRRNPVSAASSA